MGAGARDRRAVVTGIGIVSPLGETLDELWSELTAPRDRLVAGGTDVIDGFDAREWLGRADAKRTDDRVHFAVAAAARAHDDAGAPALDPRRTGVVIGNVHGAAKRTLAEQTLLEAEGRKAVTPYLAVLASDNAPAAAIAQRFEVRGPCQMVGGACASGSHSIADAAELIRRGRCDAVFAGATAGALPDALLAAYENLRVISTSGWVRPFDARRDGFVYRLGAAVLVVESAAHAAARGARVYGEIAGAATTNDAWHPIRQSGIGVVECLEDALADAGLSPADIVHVNAHGSGTQLNDSVESAAIREVFGAHRPSVTSIKGVTGHSLGASGSFEAASVLLSFERRVLPPAGFDVQLDPELDVDVVVGAAPAWEPGPTLSNSFGLGGQNATVVLVPPTTPATGDGSAG